MNKNINQNLLSIVPLKSQFSRSTRIDQDSFEENSFIYSASIDLFLNTLSSHQENEIPQGAYTWTGPYGSGKSTLALSLLSILTGNKKNRLKAAAPYNEVTANRIWNAFPPKKNGWQAVTVIGERISLSQAISEQLKAKNIMEMGEEETPSSIIKSINKFISSDKDSGGLFLIIDEMGKLLEYSVSSDGDVYLFQLLAEAATRSNGQFVFVGILHQTFQEYSSNAIKRIRDEWGKVQGRFVDISLNLNSSEQIELISATISSQNSPKQHKSFCGDLVNYLQELKRAPAENLAEMLENCWPLNPITAICLGPMSRRSYGQNQRSIFSFLGSGEPLGFKHFLENTSVENIEDVSYGLAEFWDYLNFNWSSLISSSQDSHSFAVANEVLASLEAAAQKEPILADPVCEKIIKIVHLLQITRPQTGLYPNKTTLHLALAEDADKFTTQIDALQENNLINYRRFNDTFTLHEGSDFDIEAALKQTLENQKSLNLSEIGDQFLPSTIIAKRHYLKTGTLRWADIKIGYEEDLDSLTKDFAPNTDHFARFLLVAADNVEGCIKKVKKLNSSDHFALALAILTPIQIDTIREYSALRLISETRSELSRDKIARREVNDRIDARQQEIENIFIDLLDRISWNTSFDELNDNKISAHKLVSLLADKIFPQTLHIQNELINRAKLSGSASRALKQLMYDLIGSSHLKNLGYTKFPAERGIYETVLKSNRLHKSLGKKGFSIIEPEKGFNSFTKNLSDLFSFSLKYLERNKERNIKFSELYEKVWMQAPFGLKSGPRPLFAYLFLILNHSKIAFYREDVFMTKIAEIDIDYIIRNPELCAVRYLKMDDNTKYILSSLAQIPARLNNESVENIEPLPVAIKLIEIFDKTPKWAQRTSKVSENAKAVRTLFKRASDPAQFALVDIPNLYGEIKQNDKTALKVVFRKIEDGLRELSSIFQETMTNFQLHLFRELGIYSVNESNLEELKERAKAIKRLSGDNRMEMFITNIEQLSLEAFSIKSLASMLVSKKPDTWIDNDIDKIFVEATNFCRDFINLETMSYIKGSEAHSFAFAFITHKKAAQDTQIKRQTLSSSDLDDAREIVDKLKDVGLTDKNKLTAALAILLEDES